MASKSRMGLSKYLRQVMNHTLGQMVVPITAAAIAAASKQVMGEIETTNASAMLKGRRAVDMEYRKDSYPAAVNTIEEDWLN